MRLLGWDGGTAFYEDTAWRPPDWQSAWRDADALWSQALALYRQRDFVPSMRKFAGVLRVMPEDQAARWYLFRCEALRDTDTGTADTGLLYGRENNP